jgi:hypothetical protein
MSPLPSTPSTKLLEISSVGQFDQDCERLWNHNRWFEAEEQDDVSLEIECTPGRILYFHGARLRGPDFSTAEEQRDFALRQICHFLIDRIESRGLEEVCQSLVEFYEYYRPTDSTTKVLSDARQRDAMTGTRSVAGPFVIEGE